MKWIGSILLLFCAAALRKWVLQHDREKVALGEELCQAIDILRVGIFRLRCPLPVLLDSCLKKSVHTCRFWRVLIDGIREERDFSVLWEESCNLLGDPYSFFWRPLGTALTAGEQEELFILTREETHGVVFEKRRQKSERDRLVTTLCFSGSLLLIVMLI